MNVSEACTRETPAPRALWYSSLADFEQESRPPSAVAIAAMFAGWSGLFAGISLALLFTWMKMHGENFRGGWFFFTIKVSLLGGMLVFIFGFLSILSIWARLFFSTDVLRAGKNPIWTAAVYSAVTISFVSQSNSPLKGLWIWGFPLVCGWFLLRRRSIPRYALEFEDNHALNPG